MECRDTKLLIDAWWDRELPAQKALQVERHLHECSACRNEYGPVHELLTHPEPVTVPDGLRDRILMAVDQPVTADTTTHRHIVFPRWFRLMRTPWVGALAACVTFFFMGWFSAQLRTTKTIELPLPPRDVLPNPNPGLLAGWAQAIALPGQVSPLSAVAQAAAFDRLTQMPDAAPVRFVRGRPLILDVPPSEATPAIPEIPIIITGLSTLGA